MMPSLPSVTLTDPATGKPRESYPPGRDREVQAAKDRAERAQAHWVALTPAERSRAMYRWSGLIREHAHALADADANERGGDLAQALAEVESAADVIEFYAGACRTMNAPAAYRWIRRHHSRISYRPLGVIGAILPWNYPLMILAWRAAPALAAGNTVIVKPAEETPHSAEIAAELADTALGLGVLTAIPGDRTTGSLLASAGLDGYAFTGSRATGIRVASAVAPAPVNLELGGNCPAIFADDAPPGSEHELIAAAFHNGGQSCAAPSRIITTSARGTDRIMDAVRAAPAPAPLISTLAVERVNRWYQDARREMIQVVESTADPLGGFGIRGAAVHLPVFSHTSLRTRETFGPIVTVEQAHSEEEALKSALDPSCGNDLAASAWTADLGYAHHLAYVLSLHVGEVWINCHLAQTPELPHSGSGGLDLSAAAMEWYRRPVTVTTKMTR